MNAKEILEIIDIIPSLLVYFLPGLFMYKLFGFQVGIKNKKEDKSNYILYVVISYMLITIGKVSSDYFLGGHDIYSGEFTIGVILLGIICGYLLGIVLKKEEFAQVLRRLKINRTINSSIFAQIKDSEKGTWVNVYLKDEKIVYSGALKYFEYEEKYEESFILLSEYITYYYNKESSLIDCVLVDERNKTQWVALKVKEISRIEIVYDEESKKLID